MLKSFVGTYNEKGLQSLRNDEGLGPIPNFPSAGFVPFWAILEPDVLPQIERAIRNGDRQAALAILANHARHGGTLPG